MVNQKINNLLERKQIKEQKLKEYMHHKLNATWGYIRLM